MRSKGHKKETHQPAEVHRDEVPIVERPDPVSSDVQICNGNFELLELYRKNPGWCSHSS